MAFTDRDGEIASIIECCRLMGSDKITERRKNGETLLKLLSNRSYLERLDTNSDQSAGFTWNELFRATSCYMAKEVEKYKADEAKRVGVTPAQKSLRDSQLELSANYLLNAVDLANRCKPRLDVDLVLHHCLLALKDPFMLEKFGKDHLNTLNRSILSRRFYWSRLKPNLWLSLFLIALKVLKSSQIPPNMSLLSLATLLNYVMHHGTVQCDITLKVRKKMPILADFLNNKTMLQKEHQLVTMWLDSAIRLALSVGLEDRLALCALTENTLNTFLDLCSVHLNDMELVVQYALLAVISHHPCGVEVDEPGFRSAGNAEEWMRTLRRLHSLTDFSIKILHQRNKTAEHPVYELGPNQVTLAVRVARQVFSNAAASYTALEATRMGTLDVTNDAHTETGPVAKKKRLMSGFSELIERLKALGASKEAIPWLQIASQMVSEYPAFPQAHEIKELLDYAVEVTSNDCREYDMMSQCFRLFRLLCTALYEHRHDGKDCIRPFVQLDIVSNLWDSLWKCLTANEIHRESCLLMATLLHYRLVSASMAYQLVEQLIRPSRSLPCDRHSMACLVAFVQRFQLPERTFARVPNGYNDSAVASSDPMGDRSVRLLLGEWLLGCQDTDAIDVLFQLFSALGMKQPAIDCDLRAQLDGTSTPDCFNVQCQRLESSFRYLDLLKSVPTATSTTPKAAHTPPTDSATASLGSLGELVCLLADCCVRKAVELSDCDSITGDAPLRGAICLLSLARNVTLSVRQTERLKEPTAALLTALLDLILKDNSDYAPSCIVSLDTVFRSAGKNDYLRMSVWERCWRKLERLAPDNVEDANIFGVVRRGDSAYPGVSKSQPISEDKTISLFASSNVKPSDAERIGLYRLLATICCPLEPTEAVKSDYRTMKAALFRHMTSNGSDDPVADLQASFFVLRAFSRSPRGALDVNLVAGVMDLLAKLGHEYAHDHEATVAVLEVVSDIGAHVTDQTSASTTTKLVQLLLHYRARLQDGLFGPPVEEAFFRCLASLPTEDWLVWNTEAATRCPVALTVWSGLQRPLNSTAVATSQVIHRLFAETSCSTQDAILDALAASTALPYDELEEPDLAVRHALTLQALASVASVSAWAEKPALVAMLQLARLRNIDTEILQRCMEHVALNLGVDYVGWMESRLSYLLDRWLDDQQLEQFPYALYHCQSVNRFFAKYESVIVPAVFLKAGSRQVTKVAELMGKEASALVGSHVVTILAKILPRLSEFILHRSEGIGGTLNRFAQAKYHEVQQLVDKEHLTGALSSGVLSLVSQLLFSIHDPDVHRSMFGGELPLPSTGSFRHERKTVVDALRHFAPDLIANQSDQHFEHVACHFDLRPWDVHSLLVELFQAFECGCRLTDKASALVAISAAAQLLVGALERRRADLLLYVFHSLVLRLGQVVRDDETVLRRGALTVLRELLGQVIASSPALVARLLVTIVGCVTPLADNGPLHGMAMDLLDFLLMENHDALKSHLAHLPRFPSLPHFAHLGQILEESQPDTSLTEEIESFLQLANQLDDNMPAESLAQLTVTLDQRKEEVKRLYASLEEGNGSSLDCGRSPLHRLICALIRFMKSKSASVVQAAGVALGELGPADLTTLILQPDLSIPDGSTPQGKAAILARDSPALKVGLTAFPLLVRYLFSQSVQLTDRAGQVLLEALSSYEGQQFYLLAKTCKWSSILDFIRPFARKQQRAEQKEAVLNTVRFQQEVDDLLWTPGQSEHAAWITRLTCTLIGCLTPTSSFFYACLLPVCKLEPDFCAALLPHVVQSLLAACGPQERRALSDQINAVLDNVQLAGKTGDPSLRTILQVVQHLRQQRPLNNQAVSKTTVKGDPVWLNNFRIDLNYLSAARAAKACGAYFSTIMYAEIWLDRLNTIGRFTLANVNDDGYSRFDSKNVQDLLFEAYNGVGEPDGPTGFQSLLSSDLSWDIRRYEQENKWFQVLECHDALASFDGASRQNSGDLLTALSRCGLYRTMAGVAADSCAHLAVVREYQSECAWRLGQWGEHHQTDREDKPGFQQLLFNSLLALKNKDGLELVRILSDSRLLIADQLQQAGSLECCRNIYPVLTSLRLLREVEIVNGSTGIRPLAEKWAKSDLLHASDFSLSEPVLALRAIMLKEIFPPGVEKTSHLIETLLDTCRKARHHGNFSVASRCLTQMSMLSDQLERDVQVELRLEKALTEWQRKDVDRAVNTLRSLVQTLENGSSPGSHPSAYPTVLRLLGQWLHEARYENPRHILTNYLQKSLDVSLNRKMRSKSGGSTRGADASVAEARQVLAAYADSLYKDVQAYIESRDFETQQKLTTIRDGKAQELVKKLKAPDSVNKDEMKRARLFMANETVKDKKEFETMFQERDAFLLQAVENYLIGIREGSAGPNQNSEFDIRISRLISLWFDNRCSARLTELLAKWLPTIPAHHFAPVLPQLAARLVVKSNPQLYHDDFPKLLSDLLAKCAAEHPHHTLPVILALAMTDRDRESGGDASAQQPEEERVTAAKKLVQKVKKGPAGAHCSKLEHLSELLIHLANKPVAMNKPGDGHKMPAQLVNLKDMEEVAMPTVAMAVNPNGIYKVVGVCSFQPTYELVGGINAPKKLSCLGTDGQHRPMLLKGKDDLRQDAVMEQVFTTMNTFLRQDEEARRRRLCIRTYKVVPLARRSGVLEWCENTMPIGVYLLGKSNKSGAHLRYLQQGDLTPQECNEKIVEMAAITNLTERHRKFAEICSRFPPVFRHFFLERYVSPSLWFEKRLCYTRSTAASSMVGYILGLGDRHLSNILIDESTAELVHIDLGIAFDQGTVLPIPETVPFRLTRDVVDAMGVLGVEGVFRRCCEFTMKVMRKNQDSILTLLEVLLYDPLYVWAVTPQKAATVQRGKKRGADVTLEDGVADAQVNESAKRTLVRLSQKLRGVEKGTPLSINGQVNMLIQQATDSVNLCRIYHGWKPQA